MSGCVGMGPSALLFLGTRDAVKTLCFYCYYPQKAVQRVYTYKMLRQLWCLDISADKQYKLICEECSF